MSREGYKAGEEATDWQRRKDIFADAIERGPHGWREFLEEKCSLKPRLLRELTILLEMHFEKPESETASKLNSVNDSLSPFVPPVRFDVQRRLGSGTFGDVYKAYDRVTEVEVALKVLRRATPDSLLRFKREFRRVCDLRHPNIVHLYDLLEVQPDWMFTMEFVDGVDFTTFHRAGSRGHENWALRLRETLTQLAEGLAALHARGLLHRDVKPSNVLVSADGHLKLLDFGLVRQIDTAIEGQHTIAGTLPYMSPEQRLGQSVSFATDWYSIGVMLYHTLTGRLPFTESITEVLNGSDSFTPPSVIAPNTPADLDALTCGLLARDPNQRLGYQAVAECFSPFRAHRATTRNPTTLSSQFVGREKDLAALWDGYSLVLEGCTFAVSIEGSSGIGKTALITEFLERVRARDSEALIFRGCCHENESIRYNGLDDLIDGMAMYLQKLPEESRERVLPRNFALLARMFPVLSPFLSHSSAATRDVPLSVEMRNRAHASLIEMLGRLAERKPVVIFLDDLQWIDPDTRLFLDELTATIDSPPLLLVLSHRAEDAAHNSELKVLKQRIDVMKSTGRARRIELERLSLDEAMKLAQILVHHNDEMNSETLRWIVDQADGDPFLIHHFVSWSLSSSVGLQDLQEPLRMDDVIRFRVNLLNAPERWLIELMCLSGQPTPSSVFKQVLGTATFFRVRDSLLNAKLIRGRIGSSEDLDVYHGRIRTAIVDGLDASRFRSRHAELANAMATLGGSVADRLSLHYLHAGEPERAGHCALDSADRAANALAFHKAVDFYRIALSASTWPRDERRAVLKKLGDALSNANRGEDAAEAYSQAAEGAEGRERLQLINSAAVQLLRCGRVREGAELLSQVLKESHLRAPKNRIALLAFILWWRVKGARRSPTADTAATPIASHRALLRMDACWAAAAGYGMIDPLRSAAFSAQYVGLARNSGDPRRVSLALAMEATQICYTSRAAKKTEVRALLDRAALLATQTGDAHTSGFVKMTSGVVAYLSGNWTAAIVESDEALQILRENCTGVSWELTTASIFSFLGRSARGNWAENRKRLPSILKDGRARGDVYSTHFFRILACCHLIDLAAGNPDKALDELRCDIEKSPHENYSIQKCGSLANEGDIGIYLQTPMQAWSRYETEWPLARRSQFLRLQPVYVYSTFTRARLALAMAAQSRRGSWEERYFLKRALTCIRSLERTAPYWSRGLPALLRCGMASFNRHRVGLRELLMQAELLLREADIIALYCAASYWRSTLERTNISAEVLGWLQDENIKEPERFMFMFAPGAWHECSPMYA